MNIEFIKNIKNLGLNKRNDRLLLAVSGGVDSIVMASLFYAEKFDIAIAHCNFSLRGKASDDDEIFVEQFAKLRNIPFYSIKFDTENFAREQKISIEMAARNLRYHWFESLRQQYSYSKIAIAHNKNDVVETFFLNLTRGTGVKGLLGIAEKTETIIRPLLFASRAQILSYANEHNIDFRVDETNSDTKFSRNRIRNSIIPEFEKINPSFLQTMMENIGRLSQCYNVLQLEKNKVISNIVASENNEILIDIDKLQQAGNEHLWLFEILQQYDFGAERIADICASLNGESGKKFFSPTHVLIKDRNRLIISKSQINEFQSIKIGKNIENIENPLHLKIEKIENKNIKIEKKPNIAFLNFDRLKFPLTLRKWQAGDYFQPFGMRGKKKLSDYFIDEKLSQFEKDKQYVLTSDEKIVWLVNHRIDDRFKVDKNCKIILKITFEQEKN